ncbi:MAG: amidohydrolase family protein [Planctomycetaceae bacterium]|jgi:imidazolonepropionase-like amidohydrolase|nr:amidohydrolase family protein [Planctomycetaceae bacterium]MBT6155496.1 amidohydrolase family protein [Planctomycetaceae bacterium]MBT6485782.1 amidohydrolase family protein [Planctomycetaceae bacterium]
MNATLFTDVSIFDGTGSDPFAGEVLVEGNRIAKIATGEQRIDRSEGVAVVDGEGGCLMPGLVEPHGHISFTDVAALKDLGEIPPEEHVLKTMHNAKRLLDSGFTSVYSAASAKPRLDIVIRNEIDAGRIPGPRMRAASPEITSTGGLGDERLAHLYRQGLEMIADGPDEMRKTVRYLIREGVDSIKINLSGDAFVRPGFEEQCAYSDAEVAAAAEEAHDRGCWLAGHARADGAVRLALKHNFRVIYHCDYATPETIDLLEEAKDRIFLAPAIGIIYATVYEAGDWRVTPEVVERMGLIPMLEHCQKVHRELHKRGLRILPGGDYGFAWNPNGNNARDLEHFVTMLGYTGNEVLSAATQLGGQIMGMGDELGLIKEGYLADLLLIDGDPTQDVTLLQTRDNLLMIMQDGQYHKPPRPGKS